MINVAFVHVGTASLIPRIMVRSVKRAMPGARVVHLTDAETRAIDEADATVRRAYDGTFLMTYRLAHLAALPPADTVFLDTDCVVQRDLSGLFTEEFDIALTRRENIGTDPLGTDVADAMPYNTGVMLSKGSGWAFWHNARDYCEQLPDSHRRWWGDQLAVKAIAEIAPLRIMQLPCQFYNYSPGSADEDVSDKYVVHYKGRRKPWMIHRGEREFALALQAETGQG